MLEIMKNGKTTHISKLVDFYDFLSLMSWNSPARTQRARSHVNFFRFNRLSVHRRYTKKDRPSPGRSWMLRRFTRTLRDSNILRQVHILNRVQEFHALRHGPLE